MSCKVKYFGSFSGRESLAEQFGQRSYGEGVYTIHEDFPAEKNILFAVYDVDGYEGSALVLFKRGRKLFEVHGSHCSCNGLEECWSPEETSWEALAMRPRKPTYSSEPDSITAYNNLLNKHLKKKS